jgi:phosphoglucomutase
MAKPFCDYLSSKGRKSSWICSNPFVYDRGFSEIRGIVMNELSQEIAERSRYWAQNSAFDEETRKEVQSLLDRQEYAELTERFYRDLEFGTGGLRGILGAGTARMNRYNICKASLALAQYLRETNGSETLRIAVSFDSRNFSQEFARAAASVFAAQGIQTLITKELRPVPMLSYMVRHFKCHAGVCITASHNPKNYNGFKVYWSTGGQLVPPHDEAIIGKYNGISSYEIARKDYAQSIKEELVVEIGSELDESYFEKVVGLSTKPKGTGDVKIVYSPLHGSGLFPVKTALARLGFKHVMVVPEQERPDGNFPTVKSPNPEDPNALAMALALAKKHDADLVMATDPDCDRIGMIIKDGDGYFTPNGNQIGCLLNQYVLMSRQAQGALGPQPLIVKTIVTTDLQEDIAHEFGAACEETLTGFKWICQLVEDFETGVRKPRREFICGGEESYGFLAGSFVRDKDGVISCCMAAEMVAYYKDKGVRISEALDELYTKHGVYYEILHNLVLPGKAGAEKISKMMDSLRSAPPQTIDGIFVQYLKDFASGKQFKNGGNGFVEDQDLTLPASNVLQFILKDGTKVSVRPSGTEPKIKFYVSVKDPEGKGKVGEQLAKVKRDCEDRAARLTEIFVSMAH